MACEAVGRCRICARKHKIAVFGGEKTHHFFIEKANLKLIILNTVCIVCIGKIERYVKTVDLDMITSDYIKKEDEIGKENTEIMMEYEIKTDIEIESKSLTNISSESIRMDIDEQATIEPDEKSPREEAKPSNQLRNVSNDSSDVTKNNTQAQPPESRDSPITIETSRCSMDQKIGQYSTDQVGPGRKRPRNVDKTAILSKDENNQSSQFERPVQRAKIAFVDCGNSSDYLSASGKKIGRFLGCDFCGKEFTHAGDLNKHRRKHTGEKPYECNQCKRKFAHASNLARHQRVHSGERPFVCPNCARTFTRRDKLAIHMNAARCHTDANDLRHDVDHVITRKIVEKTQT